MTTPQKTYTLITGASSGIGRELTILAAKDGERLVIVARDEKSLAALADKLQPTEAIVIPRDLSKAGSAKELTDTLKDQRIHVSTLVNNAGFGDVGLFDVSDLRRQQDMIQLNITTLTELTRLLLPQIRQSRGRVLNVASIAGFVPGPLMSVYFASKAYVLSFSEALHREMQGTGVSVTCLCPGPTKTNFGKAAHAGERSYLQRTSVTAASVAQTGWEGMKAGKAVVIPGAMNRLAVNVLLRLAPRNLVRGIVWRINQRK